jgi:hypothetical protein
MNNDENRAKMTNFRLSNENQNGQSEIRKY